MAARKIRHGAFYDSDIPHRIPTYSVELTEIMEDAKKILQSNGIE